MSPSRRFVRNRRMPALTIFRADASPVVLLCDRSLRPITAGLPGIGSHVAWGGRSLGDRRFVRKARFAQRAPQPLDDRPALDRVDSGTHGRLGAPEAPTFRGLWIEPPPVFQADPLA